VSGEDCEPDRHQKHGRGPSPRKKGRKPRRRGLSPADRVELDRQAGFGHGVSSLGVGGRWTSGGRNQGPRVRRAPGEFQHRGRWPRSLTRADKSSFDLDQSPPDRPAARGAHLPLDVHRPAALRAPSPAGASPESVMPHPHTNPPWGATTTLRPGAASLLEVKCGL